MCPEYPLKYPCILYTKVTNATIFDKLWQLSSFNVPIILFVTHKPDRIQMKKNCTKSWINLKKKNTAGNIWDQKIQIKSNNSIMHHSAQNKIKLTLKWKMSQKSHYFLFTQSNNAFK